MVLIDRYPNTSTHRDIYIIWLINHQHLQFRESVKLLYVCSMWWVVVCWARVWFTHTNVFLIFPVRICGDKNYINASVDAPRRDTSIAVVGVANRARIKKLIFCILVIKPMKTAFAVASSEFWLFYYYSHGIAYRPIDSWIDGLNVPVIWCKCYPSISKTRGSQSQVCVAATAVPPTRRVGCHHSVVTEPMPFYPPSFIW